MGKYAEVDNTSNGNNSDVVLHVDRWNANICLFISTLDEMQVKYTKLKRLKLHNEGGVEFRMRVYNLK